MKAIQNIDYNKLYTKREYLDKLQKKHSCCIYFLYKQKELVYIGKTGNVFSRICGHIDVKKKFDNVKIMYVKSYSDMHIIEPYLICKHKPKLNKEFNDRQELRSKISVKMKYKKAIEKTVILF